MNRLLALAVVRDAQENARKGCARDLLWLLSPDALEWLELAHIDRQEVQDWVSRLLVVGVPPLPYLSAVTDYSESARLRERELFEKRIEKRHAKWKKNFKWKEHYGKREQAAKTEPRNTSKAGWISFTTDATSGTDG